MKIAMFGHKRIPSREGGVEIVVEELASRMVKTGNEVTCFNRNGKGCVSQKYGKRYNFNGIEVKTVPTIDKKGMAAVTAAFFSSMLAAFGKYDIVHIHAEGPAFFCWIPKLFHKKIVVTVHGLDWQREKWKGGFGAKFIRKGEENAVKYADEIIVLSKNVEQYFKTRYNRITRFIPNGVNRPKIRKADRIQAVYGLEKNGYILFLGRLVPEKGIMYLIEAFSKVNTDLKLVIAGGSSDTDEYEKELRMKAEKDSRILFTGFVEGDLLEELYSNAYAYTLPSDLEGMPLSLLEAMSYENCCLVSDIKELTEVVEDKAVVFPHSNTEALAEKLQYLCDHPAFVTEYQEIAADFICKKYDWDTVTDKTLRLYKDIRKI